jgi:DNA-binding CsgD family transcriptional regulator
MTFPQESTEGRIRPGYVPSTVGGGGTAVGRARGDARRVKAVFERSLVPMVMVDAKRRYVNVNRPALLWFRASLDEMREYAMDDLAPTDQSAVIERGWARLVDAGVLAGHYLAAKPDGSRVDIVYNALADVLPGQHVVVFARADWPEDELIKDVPYASLTPREIDLLALAAEGLGGRELAERVTLSPATVNTHFKNIHEKLQVRTRAAAVAKAMRLGMID